MIIISRHSQCPLLIFFSMNKTRKLNDKLRHNSYWVPNPLHLFWAKCNQGTRDPSSPLGREQRATTRVAFIVWHVVTVCASLWYLPGKLINEVNKKSDTLLFFRRSYLTPFNVLPLSFALLYLSPLIHSATPFPSFSQMPFNKQICEGLVDRCNQMQLYRGPPGESLLKFDNLLRWEKVTMTLFQRAY